jgi:hypothetical protein
MIGTYLLAWVVFTALALALCAGAGLLVRRAAGRLAVPGVLTLPLGLATLVVVAGILCDAAALAPLAAPALVVVGVGGLILERRSVVRAIGRRGRGMDPWALAAGCGAWALVAAPIVLSGKPGFTGYAHIVDISYEFDLAAHFAHSGRHIPAAGTSAYEVVLKKYLGTGYPGGGPWTLGALSNLMPVDLSWLYQPFLALLAAMSGLSIYALLGSLVASRPLRALAALVAALPNVLYAYVLAGGIKELSMTSFLLLTAALLGVAMTRLRPGRSVLAVPVAFAATVASFSLTALPWLGVLTVGTCGTAIVFGRARRAALLASVQMAAVAFVLSLPTLAAAFKLLPVVSGKGPVDLGNLAAPIPGISAAGVWITGDVRFPQDAHQGLSEVFAVLVLVLAVCGVVFAVRRRAWNVAWLGAAGAIALYYVAHRYGPWIQFKADCMTSPIAVLLAFAGAGGLMRALKPRRTTMARAAGEPAAVMAGAPAQPTAVMAGAGGQGGATFTGAPPQGPPAMGGAPKPRRRPRERLFTPLRAVVLLAALAVAGAILAGNALLYHDTTISPYARLRDLQGIGERFAGQGPTLTPDFEEYAEYYLRDDEQDSVVNGPSLELRPGVNRELEPGGIWAYDLDEFPTPFLERFRTIVIRRDPLASRAPSNYRLAYSSPYYEVWQRAQPAKTVVLHLHFADAAADRQRALCGAALAAARGAGADAGAQIAYTLPPHGYVQVDGSNMALSGSLNAEGGTIVATGPGRAVRRQPIPATGAYDFFFSGSFGRPVDVYVDGRHVGTAAYQVSYPDQWTLVATRKLTKGVHRIELRRGGISAHAGNGDGIDGLNRTIGPLVIYPAGAPAPPVRYEPLGALAGLCRSSRRLRWLEIVRPA